MAKRLIPIEIVQPDQGLDLRASPSMINIRNTPNVANCNAYYGVVQKDYGTTLFATGTGSVLGVPTNMLYEANFLGETTLQAFTHTGMYKYSSGTDAWVTDGQTYTGTFTDFWSACMHNDVMVYSNGVDLVQYKTVYNATGTVMGGVVASSYKAYAVVSFKDHLNIYHTYEAGNECRKRVRWTKVGTLAYATSDWSTGTANFLDLQDMDGDLMCAAPLGNGAVAIYGENSIHVQEWVGGADVYRFTKTINNVGAPSRRSVVSAGAINYVLTRNNIYEYAGGGIITPIGDPIQADYTSQVNDANIAYAFMQYVDKDDELRVYVPTSTGTQPDTCYICKVKDNYKWFKDTRPYTSCGKFTRQGAITIGDLVGSIGEQNWKFGDMSVAAGSPVPLLGDASGRVVKMDKTVYSISVSGTTTGQSFVFDTKDISSVNDVDPLTKDKYDISKYMDNDSRWLYYKVEAKGAGTLNCLYSNDGGSSFTAIPNQSATLTDQWAMYTFDIDVAAERIMMRHTNTGTNESPQLRYGKLEFIQGARS